MRVLLLNPPNFESQYINRDLMGGMGVDVSFGEKSVEKFISYLKSQSIRLPVLSLAYVSSILRDLDVKVIDAANTDLSAAATINEVKKFSPDFILSTTSISGLYDEIGLLSEIKNNTSAKIGLCGAASSFFANEILKKHDIDFIIMGEPEAVIENVVKEDFKGATGTVFCKDKKIMGTREPRYIDDLDILPYPDWEKFPIESYGYRPLIRKKPFLTVLSSRGCPYGCIYCPYSAHMGRKWRSRSSTGVVDELIHLKEKYEIEGIQFRDPLFSFDERRTFEICEGMIKNKLDLEWGCETRVDCLNERLIDIMANSGCKLVNIGIESTSADVLKVAKRKSIDKDEIKKFVSYADGSGIKVAGFFILGLPGDNRKSIEEMIDFASSLDLSYAEFKIATPFPGTPLYSLALDNGWIDNDITLSGLTSYNPVMRIDEELGPEYLKKMSSQGYRRFYLSRKRMLKQTSPENIFNTFSLCSQTYIKFLKSHFSGRN